MIPASIWLLPFGNGKGHSDPPPLLLTKLLCISKERYACLQQTVEEVSKKQQSFIAERIPNKARQVPACEKILQTKPAKQQYGHHLDWYVRYIRCGNWQRVYDWWQDRYQDELPMQLSVRRLLENTGVL